MKVVIIGSSNSSPTDEDRAYYQKYIDFFKDSSEYSRNSIEINSALLDDLFVSVGDGEFYIYDSRNKVELKEYDVIFFRGSRFKASMDVVATINAYANINNIKTVNTYGANRDPSKLLQAVNFELMNIPVAKTVLVNDAGLKSLSEDGLDDWVFPCILKARYGSHGNDNYLVKSKQEVVSIVNQDKTKGYVLQRFIENDGDFRILIVGKEAIVIGRNAQDGSHLNNTSQGGSASLVLSDSIPIEIKDHARNILSFYDMTIGGVDAIQDKTTGEFFFLEVNAQPQLMTGAFIEEKKMMLGKLFDELLN